VKWYKFHLLEYDLFNAGAMLFEILTGISFQKAIYGHFGD